MTYMFSFIKLVSSLFCVFVVIAADGPVYLQPSSSDSSESSTSNPNVVTQTVYGFLDFTTTIANTVMVFSPQSASSTSEKASISEKDKEQEQVIIIKEEPTDTFGNGTINNNNNNIQPTKPSQSLETYLTKETFINKQQKPNDFRNEKMVKITQEKHKENPIIKSTQKTTTKSGKSTGKPTGKPTTATAKPKSSNNKNNNNKSTTKANNNKSTTKAANKTEKQKTIISSEIKTTTIAASKVEEIKDNNSVLLLIDSKVQAKEEDAQSINKDNKNNKTNNTMKEEESNSTIMKYATSTENVSTGSVEEKIIAEQTEGSSKELETSEEPAVISSNVLVTPEYDFLARQPTEVVDETYRVVDLKPNGKYQRSRPSSYDSKYRPHQTTSEADHPMGLISTMVDLAVKDGLTTHYETSVIGTVISGKYAQVLSSTSHITPKRIKPTPSSTQRILKTAAPSILKSRDKISNLEATPVTTVEDESSGLPLESLFNSQTVKSTKRPFVSKNRFSSNHKNKPKEEDYATTLDDETLETDYYTAGTTPTPTQFTSSYKKSTFKNSKPTPAAAQGRFKPQNNRFGKPSNSELATVSVFSETVSSATTSSGRRFQPSSRRSTTKSYVNEADSRNQPSWKKDHKPRITSSNSDENNNLPSSSKFKLSRPSGRWQYKTSPKPRVTIRRHDELLDNVTSNPMAQFTPDIQIDSSDQELSGSGIYPSLQHEDNSVVQDIQPSLTVETLRVEISTPADFKDVYYEIATIKSPYSFQIGTVKNTRYITVTSTFEKNLVQPTESPTSSRNEPLTENILATTHNAYDKEPPLDSSIATLPPIGLAGDADTPPLETITESFSTTQLMLKTHILPVVRGASDTTKYTLVQSYHVTRLVTATKTLPPMEVYQFVPSKTLNEFNTRLDEAGSELNLDIDFGDNNNEHDEQPNIAKTLLSDLDLTNIGSDFDISDVDKNKLIEALKRSKKAHRTSTTTTTTTTEATPTTPALTPEQLQQLAILKLLNPNAAFPPLTPAVTSSRPVIKIETSYETHIIPIINGASTFFTTISRPTATATKTEFEYVTSTMPLLQPSAFNPLFPSFQVTTTPLITQTMVTETESKILKLTFGAKTAYTTLYSTKVVPTILTTYLTNSIPVQPTAATFPSFFNNPYGAFPFVG